MSEMGFETISPIEAAASEAAVYTVPPLRREFKKQALPKTGRA